MDAETGKKIEPAARPPAPGKKRNIKTGSIINPGSRGSVQKRLEKRSPDLKANKEEKKSLKPMTYA